MVTRKATQDRIINHTGNVLDLLTQCEDAFKTFLDSREECLAQPGDHDTIQTIHHRPLRASR